jgi:hypothetical protein
VEYFDPGGWRRLALRGGGELALFRCNNLLRTLHNMDMLTANTTASQWGALFEAAWVNLLRGSKATDVLVLNTGAHVATFGDWTASSAGIQDGTAFWAATARVLKKHFRGTVIFRTLYTGQVGCAKYTKPLSTAELAMRSSEDLPHMWGQFAKWNRWIQGVFQVHRVPRFYTLNATMMSLRPDGRMQYIWHEDNDAGTGNVACCDCLHFAQPGPVDELTKVLFHFLHSV